jgi:hypothetical protein
MEGAGWTPRPWKKKQNEQLCGPWAIGLFSFAFVTSSGPWPRPVEEEKHSLHPITSFFSFGYFLGFFLPALSSWWKNRKIVIPYNSSCTYTNQIQVWSTRTVHEMEPFTRISTRGQTEFLNEPLNYIIWQPICRPSTLKHSSWWRSCTHPGHCRTWTRAWRQPFSAPATRGSSPVWTHSPPRPVRPAGKPRKMYVALIPVVHWFHDLTRLDMLLPGRRLRTGTVG